MGRTGAHLRYSSLSTFKGNNRSRKIFVLFRAIAHASAISIWLAHSAAFAFTKEALTSGAAMAAEEITDNIAMRNFIEMHSFRSLEEKLFNFGSVLICIQRELSRNNREIFHGRDK